MGIEIERKFLVTSNAWRLGTQGISYCQGYLSQALGPTVRIRIEGDEAFLTIKGPSQGISRPEFEYTIPFADAVELQRLCSSPLVTKTRYHIPYEEKIWEVDEFHGDNEGLIVAEVELAHAEEAIQLPPWVGQEVSHDRRYYNSNLATNPYKNWQGNVLA